VLKTPSPTTVVLAPKEKPLKTLPSSNAITAVRSFLKMLIYPNVVKGTLIFGNSIGLNFLIPAEIFPKC
jgi:hypothetical protein